VCFEKVDSPERIFFEISDRRRDNYALWHYVAQRKCMIGFNNLNFDWPMLQYFMEHPEADALEMYNHCQRIILGDRDAYTIWNPIIPQIDLYRIHHFNNKAKATSLKKLQFNMRSQRVQDLPYPVGTHLSYAEIGVLLEYNGHDVGETKKFYHLSLDKIALREAIEPKWMNQSDTGLGRKFFERELEATGVVCFSKDENGRRQPNITWRPDGVRLSDVIFPYIRFHTPVLQEALELFRNVTVQDAPNEEGVLKRVCSLDSHVFELGGLQVTMGLGGIHASLERVYLHDCDILDLDVTSFYPSIAIKNNIYPEHLGPAFCHVYDALLTRRLQSPKGSPDNQAIKLALNSVFGSSGSHYTCFYDLAYMLATTINGQFLILSLAELLLTVDGVKIVQINTDGLTIIVPPGARPRVEELSAAWSAATQLQLEANTYSKLWMRDVNNYIAEYPNGKRKRKGAYEPSRQYHQNHSMPIIRMAAEAAMCDGRDVCEFIRENSANGWDFMLRLDLSKQSHLLLDDGTKLSGIVRYYVSENGHTATKVMANSHARVHAGGYAERIGKRGEWTCTACNEVFKTVKDWEKHATAAHTSRLTIAQEYNGEPIDYDMRFYANEAEKLVIR